MYFPFQNGWNGSNLAGRPAEVPGTHIIFSPDILHSFSGIAAHVDTDGFFRISVKHDPPMLQNDTPVTQLTDRIHVVADIEDRPAFPGLIPHPAQTFLLESHVTDRQDFIHDHDLRIQMGGY